MQLIQEIQCPNRRHNGQLRVSPERKNWKDGKKEKLLKTTGNFPKTKRYQSPKLKKYIYQHMTEKKTGQGTSQKFWRPG